MQICKVILFGLIVLHIDLILCSLIVGHVDDFRK